MGKLEKPIVLDNVAALHSWAGFALWVFLFVGVFIMTNLDTFIQETKANCEKATSGPWQGENENFHGGFCIEGVAQQCKVDVVVNNGEYDGCPEGVPRSVDADFIAHSRTALPKALEIIEELRGAVQKMIDQTTDQWVMVNGREALARADSIASGGE